MKTRAWLLRRVVFALVALFCFLGIAEGGMRMLVSEEDLLFSYERADGLIQRVGGTLRAHPGVRTAFRDGPYRWDVIINTDGLRADREIPRSKPEGTYRILAIGDSWIFGYSVDQGKTISDMVAQELSKAWGKPVEVLNAGIPGACAFDMAQIWKAYASRYEFDAVLMGTPHNGQTQRARLQDRGAWYAQTASGPRSHLRLYLALRRLLYQVSPRTHAVPSWTLPQSPNLSGDEEAAVEDLRGIALEAKQRGRDVWFADLPGNATGALSGNPEGKQVNVTWARALKPLGVIVAGHALQERACWGFSDHVHPSEAGANAIAQTLAAAILGGYSLDQRASMPRCRDVEGVGPGKGHWPTIPIGNRWENNGQVSQRP